MGEATGSNMATAAHDKKLMRTRKDKRLSGRILRVCTWR